MIRRGREGLQLDLSSIAASDGRLLLPLEGITELAPAISVFIEVKY